MTARALLFLTLVLVPAELFGQSTGILRGQVLDPSGAAVPGAKLTLTGPNNSIRAADSDSAGTFRILGLEPGQYLVRATMPGFAPFEGSAQIADGALVSFEIKLAVAADRQEVTVADQQQVELSPAQNASAVVLNGNQLDLLSDNPEDLEADLEALAGPAAGPNGGQIFIDGFSNGQLPPKESIREIRVNSDPFSAQYDRPGFGRIEVLTKPGTDHFRGSASFNFSDSAWNTRNPYSTTKPATQMRQYQTELSGSVNQKTSFNIEANHANQDSTALINALILDDAFQPVRYTLSVPAPNARTLFSPRVDYALTPNHTLQTRYSVARTTSENNNIGSIALLSRATTAENTQQNFQVSETAVIGTQLINEARFQYRRSRTRQTGDNTAPQIHVLDAFTGGGALFGVNYYHSDNFEFQNNTSYSRGAHFARFGIRIRKSIENGLATSNYNGDFAFTSITAYAITKQGQAQGLSMDQIRALGGGPSQYVVSGGNPLAGVGQIDVAPFVQDDWRVRPNITLSLGLRYETQTNIHDHFDWAPRAGLAWGIGQGRGRSNQPRTVLRAGFGLFYDRLSEGQVLTVRRQDGIHQQDYVITDPAFFPVPPPVAQLAASGLPQAVRLIDSNLRAPQTIQTAVGIERQLPRNVTLAVNYTNSRGVHQFRTRNINAPLPGTYSGPGTGVYPYGAAAGQLVTFESGALFKQSQLTVNVNARVNARMSLFSYYTYGQAHSNTDGINTYPANTYDLSQEWGRAAFDIRSRFQFGGSYTTPFGVQLNPQITASSAPPLNIITGEDSNGDVLFLDRPAFATDLRRPSVRITRWGNFDTNPLPGAPIIPRNYGFGYGYLAINLRVSKTWTFGELGGGNGGSSGRRYGLTASVQGRNLLNTVNPANPSGNLSSPLFGVATTVNGGTLQQNANRRLEMQLRFAF